MGDARGEPQRGPHKRDNCIGARVHVKWWITKRRDTLSTIIHLKMRKTTQRTIPTSRGKTHKNMHCTQKHIAWHGVVHQPYKSTRPHISEPKWIEITEMGDSQRWVLFRWISCVNNGHQEQATRKMNPLAWESGHVHADRPSITPHHTLHHITSHQIVIIYNIIQHHSSPSVYCHNISQPNTTEYCQ